MNSTTMIKPKNKIFEGTPKLEKTIDITLMIIMTIVLIFIVEATGRVLLLMANYKALNFFYNFILGFGILTGVAFIFAVVEEIKDSIKNNKGAKNGISK